MNEKFELIDLREKPKPGEPTSPWYNAGIYAFRPGIFDFIAKLERSPRGEYELTDAIRNLALAGNKVQALELAGDWVDVRDPEILAQLNAPASVARMAIGRSRSGFAPARRLFFAEFLLDLAPPGLRNPGPNQPVEKVKEEQDGRHPFVVQDREEQHHGDDEEARRGTASCAS